MSQGCCAAHAGCDPAELSVHLLRASLCLPRSGAGDKALWVFYGLMWYRTETSSLQGLPWNTHVAGLHSPCPNGGRCSGPFLNKTALACWVREAAHGLCRTFFLLLIQRKVRGSCNKDLQTSSSKRTLATNVMLPKDMRNALFSRTGC